MKKLIISALAALALVFGVTSCSGDLHDDVRIDPNAMKGYWSYMTLDASLPTSGEVGIIVSTGSGSPQSGAFGSPAFLIPSTAGTVNYIVWDGKGGSDLTISTRTDAPSLDTLGVTLGSTEFAILIFTPSPSVNLWVYDSVDADTNLTGGIWPGQKTTSTVTAQKISYYVSGVKLVGYTMGAGSQGLFALEAWIPGNEWGETSPNKTTASESDGSYLITFASPAKIETTDLDLPSAVLSTQIIDFADTSDFWADSNKIEDGSTQASVPSDAKDKTYILVITYSEEGNTAALVAE